MRHQVEARGKAEAACAAAEAKVARLMDERARRSDAATPAPNPYPYPYPYAHPHPYP